MRTQVEPIILLTRAHQNQLIIAQCCEHALAHGVKVGMKLSHARALIPFEDHEHEEEKIIVEPLDEEQNLARLHAIAQWCMKRFSPRVAADPPNGLIIDVTGCERLFHGEDRLLAQLLNTMCRFGFNARTAIAPTVGCAWAVARYRHLEPKEHTPFSGGTTVPRGGTPAWNRNDRATRRRSDEQQIVNGADDLHEALAPLPVQALRLEEETVDALAEIGIVRIEHLLALPRGDLMSRYGPDLLLRLDQAFGEAFETIDTLRSDEPPSAARQFAGPTKQFEAITQTARDLLNDLIEQLAQLEAGALAIELELKRVDAPPVCETIRTSRPTRDRKHLWLLISPKVERAHLGYGVEEVMLTATRVARMRYRQTTAWHGIDREDRRQHGHQRHHRQQRDQRDTLHHLDAAAGQLIDTIADRIGWDRVQCMEPVDTHVPERVTRWNSILDSASRSSLRKSHTSHSRPPLRGHHKGATLRHGNQPSNSKTTSRHIERSPSPISSLKERGMALPPQQRPSMLFDVPKRIDVIATTPDGPVMCIRYAHEREFTSVTHSIGPERINAEWWEKEKRVTKSRSHEVTELKDVRKTPSRDDERLKRHHSPKDITPNPESLRRSVTSSLRHLFSFRDYFLIADIRGRWLWIFRASTTGEWFIHGEWA